MTRVNSFALLTDFGTHDGYVGAVKAVIASLVPDAHFIDLCHEVAAQDVVHGAQLLQDLSPYLPRACVVLAVVDPGVGTARRGIAVEWVGHQRWLVGPDNGLLWPSIAGKEVRIHSLENSEYRLPQVASTFHARDVFAPAAAHLALGIPVERFGAEVTDPRVLELPQPVVSTRQIAGEILRADHYGNLISSIPETLLPGDVPREQLRVQLGDVEIAGVVASYGHRPVNNLLATVGGFGRIELAVHGGSAAQRLGYRPDASYSLLVRW
ncbi:MAG: SAM-dependent chlorinase/fluorinase [Pseudomonadota bacterium]